MTRETKIGLLLGMGVILLIGIIISDQLSAVQQDPADFTNSGVAYQRSIDNSDAAPGQGLAPGYAPAYTPGGTPADSSNVTDIPEGFLIPDDVRATLPQRQANGTTGNQRTNSIQPPTAYNVNADLANPPGRPQSDVPTMTIGNQPIELPHNSIQAPSPVVSRIDTPNISPTSPSAPVIRHTVVPGESLIKIARRYYGNGEYWRAIALANPGKVSKDGGVNIGVVLSIPKRDDAVLGLDIESIGQESARPTNVLAAATRGAKTIEVKSGDTLSELASKHLGSAALWQDLLAANKDKLADEHSLQVGMKLRLPGTTGQAQASAVVDAPSTTRSSSGNTYTVKPGDNLTEIAEKMLGDGDKWRMVYDANRDSLKSPDRLIVGQKLRIPS